MLGDVELEIKVIVKIINMHMPSLKYQFRQRAVYPVTGQRALALQPRSGQKRWKLEFQMCQVQSVLSNYRSNTVAPVRGVGSRISRKIKILVRHSRGMYVKIHSHPAPPLSRDTPSIKCCEEH